VVRPSRSTPLVWLLTLCVGLAIYVNGAPTLVRTGLVILSALVLGLLTYDLLVRPPEGRHIGNITTVPPGQSQPNAAKGLSARDRM